MGPRAREDRAEGRRGNVDANPFGAFWSHFLARYNDEAARSRQVGAHCRWRTGLKDIVVGQQVQDRGVRIFVRGRHGVTIAHVIKRLAPYREAFEAQFGVALAIEEDAVTAAKRVGFETSDPSNWNAMADWLRAQSDAYKAVLSSALASPVAGRKKRASEWRSSSAMVRRPRTS